MWRSKGSYLECERKNPVSNEWEVLAPWIGLEDVENSWEPLRSIYADVPTKVQEYVDSNAITDLDWLKSTSVPVF
ncbi:polyprotein [Phytophthora megakarya]|uniref:Polyprotein n=1 Tax=Phytophthora megakarya TaxID=4795 RepID=A0A225W566_9STRA|nr:polyprotein [Phytophthora megakarya]